MDEVITVRGLKKRFGKVVALDGVDLTVHPGELVGFLGPNGSGKSTTIRILLGLLRYDGGTVRLFGGDPHRDAVTLHRRLAYVPGDVTLWPHLSGGECIDLLLALRGAQSSARARRAELIDRFALDPTKKSQTYSKGNRQKVALIAALCTDVDLLVLDEPTSGLDPLMTRQFILAVRELSARGTAVLMSSHLLSEVEELCESVTIVRDGRTVLAGSLDELRRLRRSRVEVGGAADRAPALSGVDGVHEVAVLGGDLTFTVEPDAVPAVLGLLSDWGRPGVSIGPPSLEELFLQTYGVDAGDTGIR